MSDHDKEFEEYLAGNAELSTLYNASKNTTDDEPGIGLDNSILAAAKREVASKPQKNKKNYSPFGTNYFIPLSTAATIFIVVAAVSFFPEQQSIDYDSEPMPESMPKTTVTPIVIAKRKKSASKELTISTNKTEVVAPISGFVEDSTLVSSSKESLNTPDAEQDNTNAVKQPIVPQAQFDLALNKKQLNTTQLESKVLSKKNSSKAKKKEVKVRREKVLRQRKSSLLEHESSAGLEAQRAETPSNTSFMDGLMISSLVTNKPNELIYDEQRWQHYSSKQWREAMVTIYKQQGKLKLQEIIERYNQKFPRLKLDIDTIIAAAKNR